MQDFLDNQLSQEDLIVKELRKMFQSYDSRSTLLQLMIEEIRLQLMRNRNSNVSHLEASEILLDEVNDLQQIIYKNEVQKLMKGFGF